MLTRTKMALCAAIVLARPSQRSLQPNLAAPKLIERPITQLSTTGTVVRRLVAHPAVMRVCRPARLAGHIEIARDKLEGSAKGPGATSLTAAMSGRFHGQFSYAARSIRMSISLRSAAKSIGLVSNDRYRTSAVAFSRSSALSRSSYAGTAFSCGDLVICCCRPLACIIRHNISAANAAGIKAGPGMCHVPSTICSNGSQNTSFASTQPRVSNFLFASNETARQVSAKVS